MIPYDLNSKPILRRYIANALFYNGIFILFFLFIWKTNLPSFLNVSVITLLIFILPGLPWLPLFKEFKNMAIPALFILDICVSAVLMLLGNAVLVLLKLQPYYTVYAAYVLVITNIGVILSFKKTGFSKSVSRKIKNPGLTCLILLFFIYCLTFFLAGSYIPPLPDNTLNIQGTAYGLARHFRPYMLNDDGMFVYNFAHPPLANFYAANSFLLSRRLEDVKYYFDYSQKAEKIQKEFPKTGESFPIYTSKDKFDDVKVSSVTNQMINLDWDILEIWLPYAYPNYRLKLLEDPAVGIKNYSNNFIIVENKSQDKRAISKALYEQIRLRHLLKEEYQKFYNNPFTLDTRITNIFFFIATVFLIFSLLSNLGFAFRWLGLFLCILYVSSPEVIVRSIGGSYTAIGNFFLVSLAYLYLSDRDKKIILFLCGVLTALADHKLLILPLAILIRSLFAKKMILSARCIIFGFLFGTFLYYFYGLMVDSKVFFTDHVLHHFLNRAFHINDLGYFNYPNFFGYWKMFINNLGWPVFILGFSGLLISLAKAYKDTDVFLYWFLTGAFIFSVVDWKETKHLILITIPLIFGIAQLFFWVKKRKDIISRIFSQVILIALGLEIIKNCWLFIANSGLQMLNKLGI